MTAADKPLFPWLNQYGTNHHEWKRSRYENHDIFYRPLGFVESAFDTDGIYYEGRADVNLGVTLEARVPSQWSEGQLRERLLLAWTALRLHHVLLLAQTIAKEAYMKCDARHSRDRVFVIQRPGNVAEAMRNAEKNLVFLDERDGVVDAEQVYRHAQNTGRVFEASWAMSKLFVLPSDRHADGRRTLRMLLVMGHSITDGLTNSTLTIRLLELLNSPRVQIKRDLQSLVDTIEERLPVPQEDHYPQIPGNRARRRWFWALTVVLRHVRKPLPAAFSNPLQRTRALTEARRLPSDFTKVFDYTKIPPLNTYTQSVRIGKNATKRLHRLCREAKASVGAGCFVLVAISMMEEYERSHPSVPLDKRRPFIGSFPINPRPFFNHNAPPNGIMLAFSDGVVLPFLPSSLDLDSRVRLLVRSAHRQLGQYQKRAPANIDPKVHMTSRGSGRVIAMNYIAAVERSETKLPPHLRTPGYVSPQGELTVRPNPTMATCGVSSVGRTHPALRPGRYDLDKALGDSGDGFVADLRGMTQGVRARDGEFLVGIAGDEERIMATVSYDANAIDEDRVRDWKERIESLLEEDEIRARL